MSTTIQIQLRSLVLELHAAVYYTTKLKQKIEDLQAQAGTLKLISCRARCQSQHQRQSQVRRLVMNAHDVAMVQSRSCIASKSGHTLVIIDGPFGDMTCTNIDRNHQVWSADMTKPHELYHKLGGNCPLSA